MKRERKRKRRKGRIGEDDALGGRRFVSLIKPVDRQEGLCQPWQNFNARNR